MKTVESDLEVSRCEEEWEAVVDAEQERLEEAGVDSDILKDDEEKEPRGRLSIDGREVGIRCSDS